MEVTFQVAGIVVEVFMGTKLGRIDKNTGNQYLVFCASLSEK
jgi:hypothetical protein